MLILGETAHIFTAEASTHEDGKIKIMIFIIRIILEITPEHIMIACIENIALV